METAPHGIAVDPEPLRPTPEQLQWQRDGLGVFFHFGINTFAQKEWSNGSVPSDLFAPTDLDTDQWVRTAKDLGAVYVILTAKHHDGFCLWPTATTDYSVASSPWLGGEGDVVGELAASCRKYEMKLGLYLSPWDRNAPQYEDPEAYDEFYLAQLREVCTNYGELHELWFDGAGSAGREYAWDRIGSLIAELQPQAMVFNMGPATIRWIGNEDGLASDPVQYVTRSTDLNQYDPDVVDLGAARYLPPECDVSLRNGWFWQEAESPKELAHLLGIHDRSIGLGANLLLNVPPDRTGRIGEDDAARCRELRAALDARFGAPTSATVRAESDGHVRLELPATAGTWFDHVELRERLEDGQRVTSHRIVTDDGQLVAEGGTVGVRRIHRLARPLSTRTLLVELVGDGAMLEAACVHDASGAPVPQLDESNRASSAAPVD
ncbi:alpha-L-fucosidase [Brachybacterium sp. P6-10-X1]|uniref:alpha-L-fucosidase n=1 Tax=Brachybacterium sp. P6-10-X1 TaxID=1903186 RepID=UPI000971B882|nr:alpha-L-fucosidase [Brachybacterium sp. P6-10-X1]APX31528.1 alpha-L-fucosidase [Brachybacterium sp. P6-10-X1]